MEPFSPEDPLTQLLGRAKSVELRPNFTQNVMRAVRQLPQQESGWERFRSSLSEWLMPRPALAGACALLAAVFLSLWFVKPALHSGSSQDGSTTVAQVNHSTPSATSAGTGSATASTEPDVVTELAQMDQFSQLLAQQDTKSLSDSDLATLLY